MAQHNIKTSLLALSMASILAISAAAHAEEAPALSFHPTKSWTVSASPVEVSTAQIQNCAISTEFDNGFIMEIGGSHKWVQSISLDLRQAALEQDKSYPMTLSVPGIAKISTSGSAIENSRIVASLDGQKKLYQAIRDNAVLDVSIENNAFRFYMVNFADATQRFERCMAGGDIQQTPSAKPAATQEPLQASISQDPYANITTNEAIAFEEAEAQQIDLSKTDRQAPAPIVAQRIPYKETVKIGETVVAETTDTMPVKKEAMAKDEPLVSNTRTIAENATAPKPAPRKRYTETLAEQIEANPEIAAINDGQDPQTAPPPPFAQDEIAASETEEQISPKAALSTDTELEAKTTSEAATTDNAAETKETTEPVQEMAKTLAIPPAVENTPLDGHAEEADAIETEAENIMTAEKLNRKQMERIANVTAARSAVRTEAQMDSDKTAPVDEDTMNKKAEMTDDTMTSSDAPFSGPFEKVEEPSQALPENAITVTSAPAETPETEELLMAKMPPAIEVEAVEAQKPPVKRVRPEYTRTTEKLEADFTKFDNASPAAGDAMEDASYMRDPDIGRKISQLENMINGLEKENSALKDELETALSETREERITISSENWNLERATMRFNEAERQVKTLGQQLQRERTQCELEKKDLEAMLFDPQVTDQQQMARLADLERKLAEAEQKLEDQRRNLELRIQELGG